MSFENLTEDHLVNSLRTTTDQLILISGKLEPLIVEYDKLKEEFNSIQEELQSRLGSTDG